MLIKETEDDSKKWNNIPYSLIGSINIVKMAILFKAINRLLSKHPEYFSQN